jgi:hypothetical protein
MDASPTSQPGSGVSGAMGPVKGATRGLAIGAVGPRTMFALTLSRACLSMASMHVFECDSGKGIGKWERC